MTPRKGETPEEFRARQRAWYAVADPEYREGRLARQREHRRRRYSTDPVYREQLLKRQRERYETDPEYRQQVLERERKRYARKMKQGRACERFGRGSTLPPAYEKTGTSTPPVAQLVSGYTEKNWLMRWAGQAQRSSLILAGSPQYGGTAAMPAARRSGSDPAS